MSKFFHYCASLCFYSGLILNADAPMDFEGMPEFPTMESIQFPIEETVPSVSNAVVSEAKEASSKKVIEKTPEINVNPFTGKIKGRKVRMRLRPDLDSRVIKELVKNELVTVIGEKGDFWAVQPPKDTKAYIFRSFVLDNVIEGNRVNIRIEPSLDAPVIAHMNAGEKLENPIISPINIKWLEITPPAQARFYISKEYVEHIGGPEIKEQEDQRLATAEQLLDKTNTLSQAELNKSFEEVDFNRVVKGYTTVVDDFSDLSELSETAKEALASFQEAYLQKRISHLKSQPSDTYGSSKRLSSKDGVKKEISEGVIQLTDKMKLWDPIEEALYSTWSNINENKSQRDYYDEQKLGCVEIEGIVEPYTTPVKNKPGDFIVREKDLPVAYIYSTQINLQNLVGKHVKLIAAPRPNNNFAFPAYYVFSAE